MKVPSKYINWFVPGVVVVAVPPLAIGTGELTTDIVPRFREEEEFVNVQVEPVQFIESIGPEVARVIAGPVAVLPCAMRVELAGAENVIAPPDPLNVET